MADNDTDGDGEYGGFVFDEGEDDESGTLADELDAGTVVAAALMVVSVVVLAFVLQPLVTGAVTDLLGGDSGGAGPASGGTPTETSAAAGETSETASIQTASAGGGAATGDATATRASEPPASSSVTATQTATPTQTDDESGDNGAGGDGTETATATPGSRSPVIDSFTVTDQSSGGAAAFDVAWNVTDADRDLVGVTVTVVADPDGEVETVEQREFDAGGAQSAGDTAFEGDGGAGEVYEISIEVADGSGNTVFSLTREVADGSSDG